MDIILHKQYDCSANNIENSTPLRDRAVITIIKHKESSQNSILGANTLYPRNPSYKTLFSQLCLFFSFLRYTLYKSRVQEKIKNCYVKLTDKFCQAPENVSFFFFMHLQEIEVYSFHLTW
jgi:hypothetical protein